MRLDGPRGAGRRLQQGSCGCRSDGVKKALAGLGSAPGRRSGRCLLARCLLLRLLLVRRRLDRGCLRSPTNSMMRHRSAVAAARPELDDARVAAGTPLEALGEIEEDLLDEVDLLRLAVDDCACRSGEGTRRRRAARAGAWRASVGLRARRCGVYATSPRRTALVMSRSATRRSSLALASVVSMRS